MPLQDNEPLQLEFKFSRSTSRDELISLIYTDTKEDTNEARRLRIVRDSTRNRRYDELARAQLLARARSHFHPYTIRDRDREFNPDHLDLDLSITTSLSRACMHARMRTISSSIELYGLLRMNAANSK